MTKRHLRKPPRHGTPTRSCTLGHTHRHKMHRARNLEGLQFSTHLHLARSSRVWNEGGRWLLRTASDGEKRLYNNGGVSAAPLACQPTTAAPAELNLFKQNNMKWNSLPQRNIFPGMKNFDFFRKTFGFCKQQEQRRRRQKKIKMANFGKSVKSKLSSRKAIPEYPLGCQSIKNTVPQFFN